MSKKIKTILIAAVCMLLSVCMLLGISGCSSTAVTVSYVSTEETEDGTVLYVYYTDGTYTTVQLTDSNDATFSLRDLYEEYLVANNMTEDTYSYAEFLSSDYVKSMVTVTVNNVTVNTNDYTTTVANDLLSVVKIHAVESMTYSGGGQSFDYYSTYSGSGTIFDIDDDYVYIVTCYHVLFNVDNNDMADNIYVYLYGTDMTFGYTATKTVSGTSYPTELYYSEDAIYCEFIGGSYTEDVAVIRAEKSAVLAVNDAVQAVTFADSYHVGGTAITIGNYAGNGISVTEGNVSVDSEYQNITVHSETTVNMWTASTTYYYGNYRVMRMDINSASGNSGGGVFNAQGEYIGMLNAGNSSYTNYSYAIPVSVIQNSIANILHYYNDGDSGTTGYMYAADLGLTLTSSESKGVVNSETGGIEITENVVVAGVDSGSAADNLGLQEGDIITAVTVDGTTYNITRTFNIEDLELIIYSGSQISITITRDGVADKTTQTYTVTSSDIGDKLAVSYKDLSTTTG